MVKRLLLAAMRANPVLTIGVALELGYRAARALRRSTSTGQLHDTASLVETTLEPRTGRRPARRRSRRRRTVR
jgi:hypothetical protein